MDELTEEQAEALTDYIAWCNRHNKDWKQTLYTDWMRAGSDWRGEYSYLHQIRNRLGPKWLAKVEVCVLVV